MREGKRDDEAAPVGKYPRKRLKLVRVCYY